MLARVSGGNSGIKDYLENGRKQDRHFSRDELDKREPIHGDLELTDSIINSIPDNGQDRYLHITMSFKERDINSNTIKESVNDFVSMTMAAYKKDEFNYYAEIHHPRLKNIYNSETNEMDERLTHVHIVIPKRNLLSSTRLNPMGNYMHNVEYMEAIQEKVNNDYSFESPKYNPRYNSANKREALGKYTTKLSIGTGSGADAKLKAVKMSNGLDYEGFKEGLAKAGEVKVRNAGKANEYLAVKFSGESKFVNLREPIFKKSFLDEGKLEFEQLSKKVIDQRIDVWTERRSKEIKYIHDASKPVRSAYKELKGDDKQVYLINRESHFYTRNDSQEVTNDEQFSLARKSDHKRSYLDARGRNKPPRTGRVHSVQSLHERTLVHQQGRTLLLLQGNEHAHVHAEEGRTDNAARLRRPAHGASRGIVSSHIQHIANESIKREPTPGDLNKVDPKRLLDYCQKTYLINPDDHKITQNKKGGYRISSGARNLSNSDFLTKHIGLDWPQANKVLVALYKDQEQKKPINEVTNTQLKKEWRDFSANINANRNDVKITEKRIDSDYRKLRSEVMENYRLERFNIKANKINRPRKVYLESLAVYNKMVKLEGLKEDRDNSIREARNSIRPFYKDLTQEGNDMKHLEALRNKFKTKDSAWDEDNNEFSKEVNAIRSADPAQNTSSKDAIQRAKVNAQEAIKSERLSRIKISDLSPIETDKGTDFKYKPTSETLFRDTGKHLSFPSSMGERSKVEVGLDFAINRYGNNLDIRGTKEFKNAIVDLAAEKDLNVKFSDKKMNQQLADKKAELGLSESQNKVAKATGNQAETSLKGATPRTEANAQGTDSKVADATDQSQIDKKVDAAFLAGKAGAFSEEIATDRKQLESFHSGAKEQLNQDKQMLDKAGNDPEQRDKLQASVDAGQKAVETAEQRLKYMEIREQKQMAAQDKMAEMEKQPGQSLDGSPDSSPTLTDQQENAILNGSDIKPLDKEYKDSPTLITAYAHGLMGAKQQAQDAISETDRDKESMTPDEVSRANERQAGWKKDVVNADKYIAEAKGRMAELGYKITGNSSQTGFEKADAGHQQADNMKGKPMDSTVLAREAGREAMPLPPHSTNNEKDVKAYIDGLKDAVKGYDKKLAEIGDKEGFNPNDPISALDGHKEIKDPEAAIEYDQTQNKKEFANHLIKENSKTLAKMQDYGMD